MKKRTIPFGYVYENGVPVVEKSEKETVMVIIKEYLNGKSLKCIAEELSQRQIDFAPGKNVWNKARVMRIIDDSRYTGNAGFPQIIDETTYLTLKEIKSGKNNQEGIDRTKGIYRLKTPVCCSECDSKMHRRRTIHHRCKEEWFCENGDCKAIVKIEDNDLLAKITYCLNRVIGNPDMLYIPKNEICHRESDKQRIENEIGRALERSDFNKDDLRQKMLKLSSLKYDGISNAHYTAQHLKYIFTSTQPLTEFSNELTSKTVDRILLNKNAIITVVLKNKQEIREVGEGNGFTYNGDTAKDCQDNTCNPRDD